ncbi:MAG: glutaminyl-tRNA synthase (glutamine-hydrolyzing) subunit B [Candidatus Ryanbacteria bacterium RIFCSPHIGHO2_02_FULL_45_43]|uniref:Aspartyl/glutamyl-tRNA(Asn/Gln) amidotransferase subunit B n=1 Tax=Candidatus Ryanbacteria bacterium RIFCSPHIGHO2_01_45_13 TaxID=1802112 RepID=A0A1G2G082_9BACT|nr:MAG: glutaminyl-tRNA synthase (glutamine-hydrolyzing) subunit B [Candidatus Ryanbacteria bacterium RIFCSPHIGHO2_01_FULL_44_130]OGZ43507.1 MAG: glutaminyl-tRNA synthase (glutamine-hydrolyzing) subunit B [Candidatus Ryanbacteria bacterium RIFCSPHIGHO2_01_45_13]OGZ47851.1 MAG: glutaminyl-tRNA synthase (glutamine-hydrolyzing) subunit B [Candidatus Ryanbacteria bacterium RIFCSPHIGHO2_02_FULL_45_43]OGZ49896.1 MAG: glutaminyl-tRNA synthase (glutamine-hydrolyzing) subunit B [Candidatus Ryanbacteria b
MEYVPTIGLEVHAELQTKSKMFCDSKNDPEETHPNIHICPVCLGHPGTLPVINMEAVKKVLLVGFALHGTVATYAEFDRKNYFYPDLPKGYQISQYKYPLVVEGMLPLPIGKSIRIARIHLEEDTGSIIHDEEGASLVDFNRAGVPLMELVSEPDVSSAEEACMFAQELQLILRYLGVSRARMERGEMRVEANVSVARKGEGLGTKVEIKNLNSFKSVERAVAYEVLRQESLLRSGGKVVQETRGWDERAQKTVSQRAKEEAHDYRYFPEPDLPPLKMNLPGGIQLEEIRSVIPELPWEKRRRLKDEYTLDTEAVEVFMRDRDMASFFESASSELTSWMHVSVSEGEKADETNMKKAYTLLRNYLITDLNGLLKEKALPWKELLVTAENFAELIKMIVKEELSSRGAKDILRIMVEEGGDPLELARERGFLQTSDSEVILRAMKTVKKDNEKAFSDYLTGSDNTLQFLIGQTIKEVKKTGLGANPQTVRDCWEKERR